MLACVLASIAWPACSMAAMLAKSWFANVGARFAALSWFERSL